MSALFHPCPFPSIKSSAEKREISYFSLELQCFFPGSEEGLPNARGDVDVRAMGMVLSPKVKPCRSIIHAQSLSENVLFAFIRVS